MIGKPPHSLRCYARPGVALFIASVLVACVHTRPPNVPTKPAAPVAPAVASSLDPGLTDELSVLATGRMGDSSGPSPSSLEAFVQSLVDSPHFAHDVAPQMLFGAQLFDHGREVSRVLKTATLPSGQHVDYLETACKIGDAQRVHPWWAPNEELLVCPDAYRPQIAKQGEFYCGGPDVDASFAPEKRCGCGPNLIYCVRSQEHAREVADSVLREPAETVARVVSQDLPVDAIFVGNETFRDRNAEAIYRRWQIASGEPAPEFASLADWPKGGRFAPRHEIRPGQHAGVLTTPWALTLDTGGRARQKIFYQLLWCEEPRSSNVSTATILGLGAADLRTGAGWQKLAAMPVCTDCHARLDYGMQFFSGFAYEFAYDARNQRSGKGKLFGRSIGDPRGEGMLNPHGFAQLAVAQDEYRSCIAKRVGRYVLADTMTNEDLQAIEAAYAKDHRFKTMMRTALMRLVAHRNGASRPVVPKETGTSASLEELLSRHCASCHGPGDRAPNLIGAEVSREALERAITEVAFGRMPRTVGGLDPAEREEFVHVLAEKLWSDDAQRAVALRYYSSLGGLQGLARIPNAPLFQVMAARANVDATPSDEHTVPTRVRRPELIRYDAEAATVVAMEALRICKAAGQNSGDPLRRCLDRTMNLHGVIRAH